MARPNIFTRLVDGIAATFTPNFRRRRRNYQRRTPYLFPPVAAVHPFTYMVWDGEKFHKVDNLRLIVSCVTDRTARQNWPASPSEPAVRYLSAVPGEKGILTEEQANFLEPKQCPAKPDGTRAITYDVYDAKTKTIRRYTEQDAENLFPAGFPAQWPTALTDRYKRYIEIDATGKPQVITEVALHEKAPGMTTVQKDLLAMEVAAATAPKPVGLSANDIARVQTSHRAATATQRAQRIENLRREAVAAEIARIAAEKAAAQKAAEAAAREDSVARKNAGMHTSTASPVTPQNVTLAGMSGVSDDFKKRAESQKKRLAKDLENSKKKAPRPPTPGSRF